MTAYFDEKMSKVSAAARLLDDEGEFLMAVEDVEEPMIREVSLLTGDREFPEDLRERMQSAIANRQVKLVPGQPPTRARQEAFVMKESSLVTTLHSLFHELAGRRIRTRHGLLLDSPVAFLRERGDLP